MQIDQFNSEELGKDRLIVAIKSPKFNDFKLKTFSLLDFYANFSGCRLSLLLHVFKGIFMKKIIQKRNSKFNLR